MLADSSGDDQSLDDIISALCGYGPLMHHSGNQLAAMLVRHVLQANTPICVKADMTTKGRMIELPDMTFEEAEKLWEETDYACEATHQDENPINGGDATAFFLEGYLYARKLLNKMQANASSAAQEPA